MMGIFSKKMNKEGAIAGMLSGIGITLLYVFQHQGIMFVKSTSFLVLLNLQISHKHSEITGHFGIPERIKLIS
jgi:Na+(H+)/acetate symporter ActP